jgi:hypothetical protein
MLQAVQLPNPFIFTWPCAAVGVEGAFRAGCELTLGTLCANAEPLSSQLEAILKDPLVDWHADADEKAARKVDGIRGLGGKRQDLVGNVQADAVGLLPRHVHLPNSPPTNPVPTLAVRPTTWSSPCASFPSTAAAVTRSCATRRSQRCRSWMHARRECSPFWTSLAPQRRQLQALKRRRPV